LLPKPHKPIWHEWEGSVLSRTTLEAIKSNKDGIDFLKRRSKGPVGGPSDFALACAAKMCKIYPADASFMTKHPYVGEFSILGGKFSHIHYFLHTSSAYNCLDRIMFDTKDSPICEQIMDKDYALIVEDKSFVIKLCRQGKIEGQTHGGALVWSLDGEKLLFYDIQGIVKYTLMANNNQFVGDGYKLRQLI
jgi:hypothetical protein